MSEQITETLPSVSTLGSFLTMAFRFDILSTPSASVTVTTIGSPSGIAATASETVESRRQRWTTRGEEMGDSPPIVNISSQLRCCITPIKQMTPMTANEIAESFFANSSIDSCSGVFLSPICTHPISVSRELRKQTEVRTSCIIANTTPNSLCTPVPTTTPSPRPFRTSVPMNAMLFRSDIGNPPIPPLSRIASMDFRAGRVSPVSVDSSISSDAAEVSRRSAGIRSPVLKVMRSPGTRTFASCVVLCPSLRHTESSVTALSRAGCAKD